MSKLDDVLMKSRELADKANFQRLLSRFDSFSESDHPRATDGKFSSGGGGPSSTSSSGGKSKAPFVNDFMKGSKNREEDMSRLSKLSDEHLKKALDLITSHRLTDEDSVYMKELIRDVLKSSK